MLIADWAQKIHLNKFVPNQKQERNWLAELGGKKYVPRGVSARLVNFRSHRSSRFISLSIRPY